jgi:hypothetical protein
VEEGCGLCGTYGRIKNVCELVIGKAGGKKILEIHRWEDNIKINFKEKE